MTTTIRNATPDDASLIVGFIRDLAEYEKLLHEVQVTEEHLHATLFAQHPRAFAVIAEHDGTPCGFAIYFYNYSTFLGKHGMYIEDIYVQPKMRGKGIGKSILRHLAAKAVTENCGRLEWWVLDWNTPSIAFYRAIGAEAMDEWTVFRLHGDALHSLANEHL